MRLSRTVFGLVFRRLEIQAAGAHSLVIESMSIIREQELELDRPILDMISEQLTFASRYLVSLIWAMHDELPDGDGDIALPAIAEIATKHRPFVNQIGPPREYLIRLVMTARDRAVKAKAIVDRSQRGRESRIALGLESVRADLQCVLDLIAATQGGLHQSYT